MNKNKVLFCLGILFLILPFGLKYADGKRQQNFVATYELEVENVDRSKLTECMEEAELYNEELYKYDRFNNEVYEEQLNLFGNGVKGSIEIPKINLKLPIYHGTEEEILTNGIGHLKESSLPVAGVNVHSILTGHRGLPEAELFTRLDELEKEDVFFLNICDKKHTYVVCDVQVVRPEDVEILEIQPEKSLVSLVTCTPYGINTHRLVVTGAYQEEIEIEETEIEVNTFSKRDIFFVALPVGLLAIGIVRYVRKRGERNETRKC